MPDKQAGRGLKVYQSAVKQYAVEHNIPLLQPVSLKDEAFLTELAAFKADLQIVVAFRMLPQVVYAMPKYGTFNLHASLLPKYRGAAPINWAIINGEEQTGLTTFLLNDSIDEGEILLQHSIYIYKEDDFGTLYQRMMNEGRSLVTQTIDLIVKGNIATKRQKGTPSFAPKIFKETTQINWEDKGENIVNFVRGLSPYPCAICSFLGDETGKKYDFKVYEVEFLPVLEKIFLGKFFVNDSSKIMVSCSDGLIQILDLQQSGKKRMKSKELLNGWKDEKNLTAVRKN
jgi:methionyl-tRNA formyltransferase